MSDPIDRQAAIDIVRHECGECKGLAKEIVKQFNELPPAQPKAIRPKFVAEDRYLENYFQTFPHCPKCNYELETGDCYCRVCGCHIDWSEDDE